MEGPPGANARDQTRVTGWRAGSRSHSDSPALRIGKLILFEKRKNAIANRNLGPYVT